MRKSFALLFQLFAAGMLLLGIAPAQQTSSATTQPSQPASSQTAAPAKKPATTAKQAPVRSATALTLKTQKEKASYALGMKIGGDLKKQGVNAAVDPAIAARGFKDALAGSKPLLTEDEERAALTQLQTEVRDKQQAKAHEEGAVARKEGEAFLAANKSKEGVVTLPSGLQYKILTAGTGPKPTASDTVTCNYRGTLLNGKEFDSSYKRGHPETFPVGGVIKGWTEALQLMPVGSKWQLFIPADMAYGDRGAGGDIGPGETLIFEVELLSIGEQKK
ncbi:MAG: FKBP-type peptidyl-prolyl cis-trans isomerase [Candidatus Sulfotelmatobacter sp.]|jgi:FKBP-type peptidyl-prolyl cis-trans isomerase